MVPAHLVISRPYERQAISYVVDGKKELSNYRGSNFMALSILCTSVYRHAQIKVFDKNTVCTWLPTLIKSGIYSHGSADEMIIVSFLGHKFSFGVSFKADKWAGQQSLLKGVTENWPGWFLLFYIYIMWLIYIYY